MADSVRFPPNIGGSGRTYTNDANPDTGLFNGGHRTNFFPMLSDTVAAAGYVAQYAQAIDGAKGNADRTADARRYVEQYGTALRSNLIETYLRQATIDFDFVRGKYVIDTGNSNETTELSDLMSITRASSKWVFGPNGKLREVPANTVARAWDPETHAALGISIERAATNLIPHTGFPNNPSQSQGTVTIIRGVEDFSGGATAVRVVVKRDSGLRLANLAVLEPYTGLQTTQCWVKANSGDDGITKIKNRASGGDYADENWQKVVFTSDEEGQRVFGVQSSADIDVTICYPQVEIGNVATTYIPTSGSPSTRAEDVVTMDFGAEFNHRAGTYLYVGSADTPHESDIGGIITRKSGLFEGFVLYRYKDRLRVYDGNIVIIEKFMGSEVFRAAVSLSGANVQAALNGEVTPRTLGTGALIESTSLRILRVGGHCERLVYLPRSLTTAELEELTA